ncbi:DUF4446 family protein [Patescibacteria group bacterium]
MFNFSKKTEKDPKNLKEVLVELKKIKINFDKLSKKVKVLENKNEFVFQKFGFIRFNPFKEVGGDQSFSIALLDGGESGFVITSYYARGGNRVYGKPVKNGKSEYALSEEEVKAINIAKNGKKNG